MLLLGVVQAQAVGGAAGGATFELIEQRVLDSSESSVVFSSLSTLAAGYTHLQIRMTLRSDRSDTEDLLRLRFNGDTGSNYSTHALLSNAATPTSTSGVSQTRILAGRFAAASSTASAFGAVVCDILDFANTNKNTTIRSLAGNTSEPRVILSSGAFLSTAAVTEITLAPDVGTNFVADTRISLYGIRGG